MQIFISWSGPGSKHIALSFKFWLGSVIQSLEPWISPDTEKGSRWNETLSGKLETSRIGIICLTKDNLNAPWILFEAGALSKSKADHVCTFLYDLKPAEVKFPLAQFQHTENNKGDIFKLVTTINELAPKAGEKKLLDDVLKKSFETYWGQLSDELAKTPKMDGPKGESERGEKDMLQEVLGTVRNLQAALQDVKAGVNASLAAQTFLPHAIQKEDNFGNIQTFRTWGGNPYEPYVGVAGLGLAEPNTLNLATGPTGPGAVILSPGAAQRARECGILPKGAAELEEVPPKRKR